MPRKRYSKNQRSGHLLTFLALLVIKAGGTLEINDMSPVAGKRIEINYDLDAKAGKATIRAKAVEVEK